MPKKLASKPKSNSRRFWLLKSEPDVFSIDDLATSPRQTTYWDGVRNYQARNTLRDDMKIGDQVLFYHSNSKPPGIAGVAEVVREGYPDFTAWDEDDPHFDPKSDKNNPTWMMVDIKLIEKFPRELGLPQLREMPELADMVLLRRGSRLSVQPVTPQEFEAVLTAAHANKE
ncbi:MAG: EVE domain-containing protein [Pirellulaceae bacterium]